MSALPPDGFCYIVHSFRKGTTTAAYNVGVMLQKIRYFGGMSTKSNVVLDYIDPTVLARQSKWLTP
jgi:hypothetical protein